MKYKELIQFDPITSVVELVDSEELKAAEQLVRTFVFSKKMIEDVVALVINNLDPNATKETFGIQIVGSYGTGKSHLMSLVSAIAENESMVEMIEDEKIHEPFRKIAGKYKVLRFELGTDKALKNIVFDRIELFLSKLGVDFSFDTESTFSWKENIQEMMAAFEAKFPNHHFLIVIDEVLEYLKGRNPVELNNDLSILRQLGEMARKSRFKIMFGVQEMLYRSPEFQFQAEMLGKISERYEDLIITREDVAFVVKERLLRKSIHQKEQIRSHLLKFAHLFEGINTKPNEYIDLFPVHPNYINNFERIKHGKNQREILKVLSHKFNSIMEEDVPIDHPGLITYDTYWPELVSNSNLMAIPDIRTVAEKAEVIQDNINNHFTGARSNRKELAQRISNALCIRILGDVLDKRNGALGENLKEDMCVTLPGVEDPELLTAAIESTAKQLVTATSGQYVDQDSQSLEFYVRTEGGVNIPQVIRDYAEEVIKKSEDTADQYFFDFLQFVLELQQNTYRTGFKIWEHAIDWLDKKSFRKGYIFFGNPNERSTTEPIQQYYIFFCPLFGSISRNDQPDEVYFDVADLSEQFKDLICMYGAAKAKHGSAQSDQKHLFSKQIEDYQKKALAQFNIEFVEKIKVIYKSDSKPLRTFSLPGEGSTKEMVFRSVAAKLLNKHFNDRFPSYPAFNDLVSSLTKDNYEQRIQATLRKIAFPVQLNRDGEAILSGLGLWTGQNIDTQNSKYADSVLIKLRQLPDSSVLNRKDLIYPHYEAGNIWYSIENNLDHQLMFVVLAALAFKGEIEISWSGSKVVNATNIENLMQLNAEDFFTYQHIKKPQGIPIKHLKALFQNLGLPDLTSDLEKPDTITKIITEAKTRTKLAVETRVAVVKGLKCRNVSLLSDDDAERIKEGLEKLATMLDSIQSYNTYGKLKSFRFTENELNETFKAWPYCDLVNKLSEKAEKFEKLVSYLYSAQSYVVESEKPLYDDITNAINGLPVVLADDSDQKIKAYETLLNSLIGRYADYYIGQYSKCRLSNPDALAKTRILQSDQKRICDIIKDIDFITETEYQNWLSSITSLKAADPNLTKSQVLKEPYHDFNPREYYGKTILKIGDLEEQLNEILEKWTQAMRSVLKDPSVQGNMDILNAQEKELIENFRNESIELWTDNAHKLRDLVNQLGQGIERVEITIDEFRKQINKPMTPQEAIDSITKYINDRCSGKERNKIRIVVK